MTCSWGSPDCLAVFVVLRWRPTQVSAESTGSDDYPLGKLGLTDCLYGTVLRWRPNRVRVESIGNNDYPLGKADLTDCVVLQWQPTQVSVESTGSDDYPLGEAGGGNSWYFERVVRVSVLGVSVMPGGGGMEVNRWYFESGKGE